MKNGLRSVEVEMSHPLSLYRNLLEGEKKVNPEFQERFIDGVAGFLNEPVWKNFEKHLIVPFDQLTEVVWRIKKIREGDRVLFETGEENVKEVRMRPSAKYFLEKSFFTNWSLELTRASESQLVAVAGKLSADLENLLNHLLFVYREAVSGEEVTGRLLLPDYPLLTMISFNLWMKIGYLLEALSVRLAGLKDSLYVLGSPITTNHQLVESEYLSLHRACGCLKEAVSCLNREKNNSTEKALGGLLSTCKVYPWYFRHVIREGKKIAGEFDPDSRNNDSTSALRLEEKVRQLKTGYIYDFYMENISAKAENPESCERDEERELEVTKKDAGSFICGKILEAILVLTDSGRVKEAELLVRVFQMIDNQVNYQEYMDMEENFMDWSKQETWLKITHTLLSRQRFRLT